MRDTYRSRVYRAERCLPDGERYESVPQIQAYCNELVRLPWFQHFWGRPNITISDGRGRRSAVARHSDIALPRWARHESVILHEIGHVVSPMQERHGPMFCRNFIRLVDFQMGHDHALHLEGTMRGCRCEIAPEDKPFVAVACACPPPPPQEIRFRGNRFHIHEEYSKYRFGFDYPVPLLVKPDGRCGRCPALPGGPREAAKRG